MTYKFFLYTFTIFMVTVSAGSIQFQSSPPTHGGQSPVLRERSIKNAISTAKAYLGPLISNCSLDPQFTSCRNSLDVSLGINQFNAGEKACFNTYYISCLGKLRNNCSQAVGLELKRQGFNSEEASHAIAISCNQ